MAFESHYLLNLFVERAFPQKCVIDAGRVLHLGQELLVQVHLMLHFVHDLVYFEWSLALARAA